LSIRRDDIGCFFEYGLHLPERTIYLGSVETYPDSSESGTDCKMVEYFLKSLQILDSRSSDPIQVVMNNIGGAWGHGIAIYDAIKLSKSRVVINVFGHAMSMGSVILQAADRRMMSKHSKMLLHYGSSSFSGNSQDAIKAADEERRICSEMLDIYVEASKGKISAAKLKKLLMTDCYLSAEESVELGLADGIL